MSDKIIPIHDKKRHVCDLGGSDWAITCNGSKSLHRCGVCKKWWFPFNTDGGSDWFRVRWFNFGMRRKIRKEERNDQ